MENTTLGRRIAAHRKGLKMTQDALAQELGVSPQAVSKWENDQAVPDALKMIQLADILDTDIEYLSTGRRTFSRRPPVVLNEVKVVEKIVEKPVVTVKTVEKIVEVPTVEYIEKPVIKRVYRTKYTRNPAELLVVGFIAFVAGLLIGLLF